MPPELSSTQSSGDVQEGSIFSRIPIWAWIAGGVVVLYVIYTKLGSTSSSDPAVTATPDQSGAPYSNLSDALSAILAQLQQNGGDNAGDNSTNGGTVGSGHVVGPGWTAVKDATGNIIGWWYRNTFDRHGPPDRYYSGANPPPWAYLDYKPPTPRTMPKPKPFSNPHTSSPTARPISGAAMTMRPAAGVSRSTPYPI